jgi:hypothetical protein
MIQKTHAEKNYWRSPCAFRLHKKWGNNHDNNPGRDVDEEGENNKEQKENEDSEEIDDAVDTEQALGSKRRRAIH